MKLAGAAGLEPATSLAQDDIDYNGAIVFHRSLNISLARTPDWPRVGLR